MAVRVRACICVSVIKICIEAGDAWYEHETLMALPSLVQLQLHTGGAAGREVEGDANLLWNIADQLLKSITTLDEACAILSGDLQGANNRPQAVNSDVRAAVRLALSKDGQRERLAERVLRSEMGMEQAEGLPPDFTTWRSLLQQACELLERYRRDASLNTMTDYPLPAWIWRCRSLVIALVGHEGLALSEEGRREALAERVMRSEMAMEQAEALPPHFPTWWSLLQQACERLERYRRDATLTPITRYPPLAWIWRCRSLVIALVGHRGSRLENASERLQRDKEVIVAAVTSPDRYAHELLPLLTEEIRADRDLMLRVVSRWGSALSSATEAVRADREVVLAAVRRFGASLSDASMDLRADKGVVLAAVRKDAWALRYASEDLRADKEVVLVAVKNDGHALQFASDELKKDREVVLEAIRSQGSALQYASDELRKDREIVLEAVKETHLAMRYASRELQDSKEVVLQAARNGLPMVVVPKNFKDDRDVVLEIVRNEGKELLLAPKKFRDDKEVVLVAVRDDPGALEGASERLQQDEEVKRTAELSMEFLRRRRASVPWAV